MNHAYEIAAVGERLEYLFACRHVAIHERNDGRCWVAPIASLSRQLTSDCDVFELARQLDRNPVGARGSFAGDVLCTVAELDEAIGALRQRLHELR